MGQTMRLEDFSYSLPESAIAKRPARPRDAGRLLVVKEQECLHRRLLDLPQCLKRGDLLVVNDVRVLAGRLQGRLEQESGTKEVEITLLSAEESGTKETGEVIWSALARPLKHCKEGARISFAGGMSAEVLPAIKTSTEAHPENETPTLRLAFAWKDEGKNKGKNEGKLNSKQFTTWCESHGAMPVPPYLHRAPQESDNQDYQTLFSVGQEPRAAAAPTAGLHFSPRLLKALEEQGVGRVAITLEVGAGTFLPIRHSDPRNHKIHPERGRITKAVADKINQTRRAGGRIVAVGTTSLRLLESATAKTNEGEQETRPYDGLCTNYLVPGVELRAADLLLTNFHLPRSTLLLLVSAFSGRERILSAYQEALQNGYRFFSYGDACLLHPCQENLKL